MDLLILTKAVLTISARMPGVRVPCVCLDIAVFGSSVSLEASSSLVFFPTVIANYFCRLNLSSQERPKHIKEVKLHENNNLARAPTLQKQT